MKANLYKLFKTQFKLNLLAKRGEQILQVLFITVIDSVK